PTMSLLRRTASLPRLRIVPLNGCAGMQPGRMFPDVSPRFRSSLQPGHLYTRLRLTLRPSWSNVLPVVAEGAVQPGLPSAPARVGAEEPVPMRENSSHHRLPHILFR